MHGSMGKCMYGKVYVRGSGSRFGEVEVWESGGMGKWKWEVEVWYMGVEIRYVHQMRHYIYELGLDVLLLYDNH